MRRHLPTSDSERLALLDRIAREAKRRGRSHDIFDGVMIQTIEATADGYQHEHEALNAARTECKLLRDELKNQQRYLKYLVRRGFAVVRARAKDPYADNAYAAIYGLLELANHRTLLRDLRDPIEVAKTMLSYNAELADEGVMLLIDPSPQQVQSVVEGVITLQQQLNTARDRERAALETMRQRRQQAHLLMRRVAFVIEHATYEWDAPARRNLMRAFGFRFKSTPQTEAEPIQENVSHESILVGAVHSGRPGHEEGESKEENQLDKNALKLTAKPNVNHANPRKRGKANAGKQRSARRTGSKRKRARGQRKARQLRRSQAKSGIWRSRRACLG